MEEVLTIAARALLEHYGNLPPHAVPDAVEVDLDDVEPVLDAVLVGHGSAHAAATAGVVVGTVEAAVEFDSLLDQRVDLFDAGDVAGDEGGFAASIHESRRTVCVATGCVNI